MKLEKPNLFLKTDIFDSHIRLEIKTKSDELSFNTSGNQSDLLIMTLGHEPTKKQIHKDAKTSNSFTT